MDSFPDGVGVNRDDGVDVRTIAPAHRDGYRNVALATGVEDEPVACTKTVDGQFEASEPIALVRIRASEVEDDIGPVNVQHARKMAGERREVLFISCAVAEHDVEIAFFLSERKVLRAMQRER